MNNVKKEGKGKLFSNPLLELFTKTNPVVHVITYGGTIAFFLYKNMLNPVASLVMIVAGLLGWTLVEYLMHRYLFHIHESRFQYMIHGVHHEYPRDKERLMMPPLPGLIFVTLFFGAWYMLLRSHTYAFMAGFMTGYMLYTFIHYMVHAWKPVRGFKYLWAHHLKHHNPAYDNKAFGVSTPLWDYIFRTMPREKQVALKGERQIVQDLQGKKSA